MAGETSVIEREPEVQRAAGGETGAGMTDMLETMEQGVKDAWQHTAAGITDMMESIRVSVETAVQSVQGAAHDSGAAVGRLLDLRAHVRRHPWLMVGGALLLGWAAWSVVGRWRR
jgi:hypothetical protein